MEDDAEEDDAEEDDAEEDDADVFILEDNVDASEFTGALRRDLEDRRRAPRPRLLRAGFDVDVAALDDLRRLPRDCLLPPPTTTDDCMGGCSSAAGTCAVPRLCASTRARFLSASI